MDEEQGVMSPKPFVFHDTSKGPKGSNEPACVSRVSSAELCDGDRNCTDSSDVQCKPNYAKPVTKPVLLLDDEVSVFFLF